MQPLRKLPKPDVRFIAFAKNAFVSGLNSLTAQETKNYLERELQDKGWNNDPEFEAPVFHLIHQFSEGVPNRINTICNYLLIQSFAEQRHRITLADARAIVEDLRLETSITRKPHNEEMPVCLPPREAPLDTTVSQRKKAHFESRNVSQTRPRARRGKW